MLLAEPSPVGNLIGLETPRRPSVAKMTRKATNTTDPIFRIHGVAKAGDWSWDSVEKAARLARRYKQYQHIADAMLDEDYLQAVEWIGEAYNRAKFPDFTFFHCTPDNTLYLKHVPYLLNVLVSHFRLTENDNRGTPIWRHLQLARSVFYDSGQITLLKRVANGNASADLLWKRMKTQDSIIETAHKIAALGVETGFVAALDHPCEPFLLKKVGMSVDEAIDMTVQNAIDFMNAELPEGFRKVFVVQGWSLEDYDRCLDLFDHYGITDEIRIGRATLAVGTTCMRKLKEKNGPGLLDVYRHIDDRVPVGRKHALGIGDEGALAHMYQEGLIHQGDSGTASTKVGFNEGAYRVEGHRYQFLIHAQFASHMLDLEYRIQQRIHGGALPDRLDSEAEYTYQMTLDDALKRHGWAPDKEDRGAA